MAGAFARSVATRGEAAPAPARASSEDWYVGVGGVPLGPVRLAVIREKALAGAVDGNSLVWREGFDEWQPLRNFPELLEIVTEAQAARQAGPGRRISTSFASPAAPPARSVTPAPGLPAMAPPAAPPAPEPVRPARASVAPEPPRALRPSAPPPPPSTRRPSAPPPAPSAPTAALFAAASPPAAPPSSLAAPPAAPPAEPSAPAVLPDLTPPLASAPAAEPSPAPPASALVAAAPWGPPASAASAAPLDVLSDPFAIKAPAPSASTAPTGAGATPAAPAPSVTRAPEPAPLVATPASLVEPVAPRRRGGMSPVAYAFIAMAAAFGGVSAFVLLSPRPVAPPPPVVQPQAAATPQAPVGPADGIPPPPPVDTEAPAPTGEPQPGAAATPRPGGPVGQRPPDKPGAAASAAPIDTSGFSGTGVAGPAPIGPSGGTPSSSLGQLSQGEISAVVQSNQPGVRRRCWQPALDARAANGPSTARVSAQVVIGASGAVESVSAAGAEKDFPGLSSCIASRIKTWKFPPSSGSTPVSIPFVFAAQ